MNIGLDLDGTISEMPVLFSMLSNALIATEHKIYIITYRDDEIEDLKNELHSYEIAYTEIFMPDPGSKVDPAKWKSELAKKLELDVMFEDSPEVLSEMPEKVKRIWICDREIYNLKTCIAAMRADMRMPVIQ